MRREISIKDRIYGTVKISSLPIQELLKSRPLRRLQKIAQFGIPDEFYHLKGFYRFEHSVGVMLLLKRLGASEEEQVAGLLHDVSHTAFSHVIDWVKGKGDIENLQDKSHPGFVNSSEIASTLKRLGFDPQKISDFSRFGLLDRDLPHLCADRIDYAFREFPKGEIPKCLDSLTIVNGKIVFKDRPAARLFARNFLKIQMHHWGGFEAASRYRLFANILRRALKNRLINLSDFQQDDISIIKKLKLSPDPKIQRGLAILRQPSLAKLPKSHKIVHKKFRHVDPEFIAGKKLLRLSHVDKKFRRELAMARAKNARGTRVPAI